jgi:ATP phosphoribosyltransferase
MVEYDVRRDALEAACAITPGIESPTISPLQDDAWAAVRAMVPRRDAHAIMDQLHELGARGVIVFDILACRL